ncbi:MAG: hypothetical protein K9L28_04765 [Synergistales bacterium]|nr:hypothetical protein [Synergistales bacterium]
MKKPWNDLAIFGRVLALALLVGGYVVFGVSAVRWAWREGYPLWVILVAAIAVTCLVAAHCVKELRRIGNYKK